MNTSTTPMLSEISSGTPVPREKLAYFQERTRNRLYAYVLKKFIDQERSGRLSRAELARRIGRKPEVITRLLGAPGNWTIGTISDLLIGIAAEELEPSSSSLLNRPLRNYRGAGWLHDDDAVPFPPKRLTDTDVASREVSINVPKGGIAVTAGASSWLRR
jgi:hypothetical protein